MKETTINKQIQKVITDNGGYVIKTIATNRSGVADIIACIGGKFIAIEGKTKVGEVSELQKAHIRQVQAAGGVAIVARSPAEVQDLLSSLGLLKQKNKPILSDSSVVFL